MLAAVGIEAQESGPFGGVSRIFNMCWAGPDVHTRFPPCPTPMQELRIVSKIRDRD